MERNQREQRQTLERKQVDQGQKVAVPALFYLGIALFLGSYVVMTLGPDTVLLHIVEGVVGVAGVLLAASSFVGIRRSSLS